LRVPYKNRAFKFLSYLLHNTGFSHPSKPPIAIETVEKPKNRDSWASNYLILLYATFAKMQKLDFFDSLVGIKRVWGSAGTGDIILKSTNCNRKKQAKMALQLPMRVIRVKRPFRAFVLLKLLSRFENHHKLPHLVKVAPRKELPSAFLRHDAPMTPPFFLKATPEKTLPGS